jgi:ABC-type nitrate/sulfonate/bicarbonate transport system substrate-binding protein
MRVLARLFATVLTMLIAASAWAQAPKHEKLVVAAAPTPLLHWYPFYVALGANYFADEGLDVEIVGLNSGTAMAAAIAGGGADVAPLAMTHAVTSGAQGGGLVATSALFNVYPNSVVLTKDAIAKSGITPGMPLDKKIKRLAGLTLGITAPGGASDIQIRKMLLARGLDPDKAVKLQPLGNQAAMLAAVQKKAVDGFVMSSPVDEIARQRGTGVIAIDPFAEPIPELAQVPYSVWGTSRATLQKRPAVIAASLRAITRAIKLAAENPEETLRVMRPQIKDVPPEAIDAVIEKYRHGAALTPVISPAQVEATVRWMNLGESKPISVRFEDAVDNSAAEAAAAAILKSPS